MTVVENLAHVARYGRRPRWSLLAIGSPADPLTIGRDAWDGVLAALGAYEAAAAAARVDEDLAASGRAKAVHKAAEGTLQRLAEIRRDADRVTAAKNALAAREAAAAKTAGEPDVAARIVAALREQEIRAHLLALYRDDGFQLGIAFRGAIEAGDKETARAIADAPAIWPLRPSGEELAAMRLAIGEAVFQPSDELQHLVQADSDLTTVIDAVTVDVAEDAGMGPDPIASLGSGDVAPAAA